jgi:ATP-dependent helicase/nuclease subunit A
MFEDLTFEQFCALDHRRNMVVTAGPGAGKTLILSHRFCFILLTDDGVTLPEILTLTFTEKAAEEMKSRIYEKIGRMEKELRALGGEDKRLQSRIKEARESFHKNRISTIHSFCASLLREHPVESGIDPGFSVIQGARQRKTLEEAIETGVSRVWQQDHDHLFPLMQSFETRRRLLRAIGHVIEHPLNFKRVRGCSERLFHIRGWQGEVFREYCRIIKDESLIPYLEGLRQLERGKPHLDEILNLLEKWYEVDRSSEDFGVPDLFRSLRQMSEGRKGKTMPRLSVKKGLKEISYTNLVETFYPDIFSSFSGDRIFEDQLRSFLKVSQVCLDHYEREKKKINALDFADLETLSHSFLTDLFEGHDQQGLRRVQKRFKYIMVDEFQDTNRVQWEIIRMLCSGQGRNREKRLQPGKLFVVGDKRQAIYRFRGGDVTVFEHGIQRILQSNPGKPVPMFWEIPEINARLRAVESGYHEWYKKQRATFENLSNSEKQKILMGDIYFPHNFRADSRPIEFINTAFDRIFSNKGAEKLHEYETAPRVITVPDDGDECASKRLGSATCYLIRDSLARKDQVEAEATLVVEILESLLGRHGKERFEYEQYAEIRERIDRNQLAVGILFFSFTHLKTFENVLREAGLPFKVHKGRGFYRSNEVMEIVQLLQYLCDERRHISLLAALRSPIFGFTDSEIFDLFYGKEPSLERFLYSENAHTRIVGEQIQSWRLLSNRLTLSELIRVIISDRGLTAAYSVHPNGLQKLANIEKLMEICRDFQAEGNGFMPEFVEHCLATAEEEEEEGEALIISPGESPICLMTIHAAKGLEFPMVILPDLNRLAPSRIPLGKPVRLYHSEEGRPGEWNQEEGEIPLWPVEIPEMGYRKTYTPLGYLLSRRDRLEDMAENRRVFYVGCTRCMNHLVLIGHKDKEQTKKEKRSLLSADYRERATIMDLLDDIYDFDVDFPRQSVPTVIWSEPEVRKFRGILYKGERLTQADFGDYDETIKKLDLSESIRTPSYYQFSFNSVRMFRKCPRMFYYHVIMGLREDILTPQRYLTEQTGIQPEALKENDEWDGEISEDALYVGNVIHRYLERHRFGDPLDKELLQRICGQLAPSDSNERYPDTETMAALNKRVIKHLERTVNDDSLLKLLRGKYEYAEVPFLFSISHGCEFRGIIDRLFRKKETGQWAVLDWKSNVLGDKDPWLVAEEHDYHFQLACYKWAVEQMTKEKVSDLYIYFTEQGKLVSSQWKGSPEDVIEQILRRFQDDEGKGGLWDKDSQDIEEGNQKECRHCPYRGGFCDKGEG